MGADWVDALAVFAIGAAVGVGELVARYRDEPGRAITSRPALLYVLINGLASVAALVAIITFGWIAPGEGGDGQSRFLRILAAGFGAMAIFRTSLFTVRIAGTDIGVGPVAFLQVLLTTTDRGVDRKRASERAAKVLEIMSGLKFADIYDSLPTFAMTLMQNLTLEDQAAIGEQVRTLAESTMREEAKVLSLGLMLMNFVGEDVLEDAVLALGEQLGLPEPRVRRTLPVVADTADEAADLADLGGPAFARPVPAGAPAGGRVAAPATPATASSNGPGPGDDA